MIIKKSLPTIFAVAIVFIFYTLFSNLYNGWQQIATHQFAISPGTIMLSLTLYASALLVMGGFWNLILSQLFPARTIGWGRALQIFMISFFGRYIPGKVGLVLGKAYLTKQEGIPWREGIMSTLYENIFVINGGLTVGLLGVSSALLQEGESQYIWLSLGFCMVSFFIVGSRMFVPPLNWVLVRVKKEPLDKSRMLSLIATIKLSLLFLIPAVIEGVGFYFFVDSIVPVSQQQLLFIIGVINLSGAIGILAIFAPSGLGVREGVMVLLLKFIMPLELAIFVSVLARVWGTLGDIWALALISGFNRVRAGISPES